MCLLGGGFLASRLPLVQSCRVALPANGHPMNGDKSLSNIDVKMVTPSGFGDKKKCSLVLQMNCIH